MNNHFFEIFKNHSDTEHWEKHIEYAFRSKEMPEKMKKEYKTAIEILINELGNGFLSYCTEKHPIRQKIMTKANWAAQEIINFAGTLRTLKTYDSNYIKLLEILDSPTKAKIEGMAFTAIASDFLQANLQVYFPMETGKDVSPDIKIVNPENNDTFYIEVSKLNNSDAREKISKDYQLVASQFLFVPPCLKFSGEQFKPFEDSEKKVILNSIKNLKQEAWEKESLVELKLPKLIIATAHPNKTQELDNWSEVHNYSESRYLSMPLNFDDTHRIENSKIKAEAKQIPSGSNGILYLTVHFLFFMNANFHETIKTFERRLLHYPNILGIILHSELITGVGKDESYSENGHFYSIKMSQDVVRHDLLFVFNHNSKRYIHTSTLDKIYSSLK